MTEFENDEIIGIEEDNLSAVSLDTDSAAEGADDSDEISFADLGLDERTLQAVEKKGFKVPSPIQVLAIPRLLNGDANIIAKARTGTGKTAAFGLPIVQKVKEKGDHVRALVLEPTRELAIQTCKEMQSFSSEDFPRVAVLYGGASYATQIRDLKKGCEIVVGTPGRIKDHLDRGTLKLDKIDYFILDEGDEMLDMGFIEDIEEIFSKANPDSRILLFSATMPKEILKIAQKFMGEYEVCEEEGFVEEPLLIEQKCWYVRESDKVEALVRLIDISPDFYGLVFTQTKMDADNVQRLLDEKGYEASALHGDIAQQQREKILARFRSRKTRILVATDVAARGIDITGLSHVVNYSLPFDSSTYVHRIGRTGRAGTSGIAVTFVRPEERRRLEYLRNQVRKAAKGEMVEEAVPEVKDVLATKRNRMIEELKGKVSPSFVAAKKSSDSENAVSEENSLPEENFDAENFQAAEEPLKIETDPLFAKIADELSEGKDPKDVLAQVLSITFGKTLDESHYGHIKPVMMRGGRNGKEAGANQVRLFVQMGWSDGYNPKKIADFFAKVLKIRGRDVDGIDMSDKFCLLSLPTEAAKKALEMSKKDRRFPHIHVDTKSGTSVSFKDDDSPRGGKSRKGGFGGKKFGGEKFSDKKNRDERKDRRDGKKSDSFERSSRGRSDRSGSRVHTATERQSASAFKKSNKKAD